MMMREGKHFLKVLKVLKEQLGGEPPLLRRSTMIVKTRNRVSLLNISSTSDEEIF